MNVDTKLPYWDDGNKNKVRWYKKGKWKRILRNRFLRKYFKTIDKHENK